MRPPSLLLLLTTASVLGAGCDPLQVAPGHDFGVRLRTASPLMMVGQVAPVALAFEVTGCQAFDLAVQSGSQTSHALDFTRQGDGSFVASVPVEWLRQEDHTCLDDSVTINKGQASLVATCQDVGRTAATEFQVSYGTGTHAMLMRGWGPERLSSYRDPESGLIPLSEPVKYIFPSGDPLHPFWAGGDSHVSSSLQPPVGPSYAADGAWQVESGGCYPLPFGVDGCSYMSLANPDGTVTPVLAATLNFWSPGPHLGNYVTWVPATVVDLAFQPSGALVVLSWEGSYPWETTVSLIPASTTEFDVQPRTVTRFSNLLVLTRFSRAPDGRLVFLTGSSNGGQYDGGQYDGGQIEAQLHLIDGAGQVETAPVTLPESPDLWGSVSLSPDATAWAVTGGPSFIGSADGGWTKLATTRHGYGSVAWLQDGVAIWRPGLGQGSHPLASVEAFDATPPYTRRFTYDVTALPGYSGAEQLLDVIAVGEHLVLTTNSGVRILGRDGTVVAGSDPLPCALSPTAMATQVGPRTVAVGAGSYLYLFDLPQ
jgi:hypothetical protein